MELFKQEFDGLPDEIRRALGARLEETVRMIYGKYSHSRRDYTINAYSSEQISGMIFSIFDLAQRLKEPPAQD